MKSIIFNTEMVKAILDGRKKEFRLPIRLNSLKFTDRFWWIGEPDTDGADHFQCWEDELIPLKSKYKIDDILYVKETFTLGEKQIIKPENVWYIRNDLGNEVFYKADLNDNFYDPDFICKWKPSVYLKPNYARIFLKVTGVRIEKSEDDDYEFVYEFGRINKED